MTSNNDALIRRSGCDLDWGLSGSPGVTDPPVTPGLQAADCTFGGGSRRLASMIRGGAAAAAAAGGLAGLGYYLVVTGKLTIDTGWGRRVRPLGPFGVQIAAPAATVFDVIAGPYLDRTPRAMSGKLQVLQRGTGMVLAEHYTPVHHGRLTAATLETVTFDRPRRITFRLVRGPVPHVAEEFTLTEDQGTTRLDYSGELGTDFAAAGRWWGGRVAAAWEAAVRASFDSIRGEAERRVKAKASTRPH